MKKYTYILTISVLLLGLSIGCTDEWLDVNTDPNNASTATAELVFPSGVVSGASVTGGWYNLLGGMWSQYWTQSNSANQYKFIDQYQINEGDFTDQWQEMYAGALTDLNYVINVAQESENQPMELMATVMQAHYWMVMVDLFGNIPYFEAFQGQDGNFSPKYDNGQDIYDDLIKRIDAVLAYKLDELPADEKENYLTSADLVFGGNIDDWTAFANTLKLKMYLRQVYARPNVAETGIRALYTSGVQFLNKSAALDIFEDARNKDNFLYSSDRRKLNVGTNLRVSSTIYRFFEDKNDPRLEDIVEGNITSSTQPLPQGGFNIPSTIIDPPTVAVFSIEPTDPVFFLSDVESYLLQAEAISRGWGTGDPQDLYEASFYADYARRGLATDTLADLLGDKYVFPNDDSFENKLKAIIVAKWAAMAGFNGLEAYFERNRTGYPEKSPVLSWVNNAHNVDTYNGLFTVSLESTIGDNFPSRLVYPQDEAILNASFPGQVKVTDKVWWDVK